MPPVARREPSTSTHHGTAIDDDYAWLRAANWADVFEDPRQLPADIGAHLAAENVYAEALLAPLQALQDRLAETLRAADDHEGATLPCADGPWAYYETRAPDADHPCYCRRPRHGGPETVILDVARAARGKRYFDLGDARHSPDHRLFAYAADTTGAERFTIRIRDIETGRDLPDVLRATSGYLAWSADSHYLFYVRLDRKHRPLLVYRHLLGTRQADDVLVYKEQDPAFDVAVDTTLSKAFVLIDIDGHHADETLLIDAADPTAPPRVVAPRQPGHQYEVVHQGDRLYITTTSEAAADYRICEAPVSQPGPAAWREIVPHVPGRRILDTVAFARHLVRLERSDGIQRIVVRDLDDGSEYDITFDEPSYDIDLHQGHEQNTSVLRFSYQSMITPEQVWECDLETGERTLVKQERVGAGYNPTCYVMQRLEAPSHDGALVPVTVLHAWNTPLDGSAPLVLEGYGGYGDALEADFAYERFLLVDRGFVYALAHVRGGEEKGFEWHAHGRHFHKPNSPKDFIAVAEHLAREGFTSAGRIVARGESAGGMLVAAAVNMAPALFLAVSANVPFVDVLNTMLDADLPLTPGEWPEWGNPIVSAADFALIRSYCPYQNVRAAPYPHVFARSSIGDQRVGYWEPAKWLAKLRANTTSASRMLLMVDLEGGGHDGASGQGSIQEIAQEFAFIIDVAGGNVGA